jgi:hypothetical protein
MIISLTKQLASLVIRAYGTDTAVTSSRTGRPNIFHVVNCTAVAVYGTADSPSQIRLQMHQKQLNLNLDTPVTS